MTRAAFGQVADLILALIAEGGPMSQADMRRATGRTAQQISSTVNRLTSDRMTTLPRRIYISAWVSDAEGERAYPRAVYSLGNRPHKPKPAADQLAVKRRYWARRRERLKTSSIFRLTEVGLGR